MIWRVGKGDVLGWTTFNYEYYMWCRRPTTGDTGNKEMRQTALNLLSEKEIQKHQLSKRV